MLELNEGWLVKVQGVVTNIVTTGGDNSLYIDDGTGVAKVYVNGYVGDGTDNIAMLGAWDPAITVGDQVSAIGLASQDAAGHRIRVRNTAEITRISYTLTYTAGANGTITGTTPQTVSYGASGTLVTAVPTPGYHFVKWSDNVMTASRTDTNVTANKTVTAFFTTAIDAYTITVVSGLNGRILPGSGPIPHHTTRVFNIRPDAGYLINSVIVDGVPLADAVNKRSYVVTLKKVEGPHTIAATFKPGH
jgi:hypothetical protein